MKFVSRMSVTRTIAMRCLTRTNYTGRPEDPMKPEILERQIAHAGYLTVERLRMRRTDGAEVSREVELPYDGPQMMKGYWNKPEETAKVMTPDGFLRTGDIATIDGNGFVR